MIARPVLLILALLVASPSFGQTTDAARSAAAAESAIAAGDFATAIEHLERAALLDRAHAGHRLRLAEVLAWAKQFDRAERIYRELLRRDPRSRNARMGLARVQLWRLDLATARAGFLELLSERPDDLDALAGLALAEYWSGDLRAAEARLRQVIARRPDDAESLQILREIELATRPLVRVEADLIDDDQPFHHFCYEVAGSIFSDALTRWDVAAGTYTLEVPVGAQTRPGLPPPGTNGNAIYASVGGDVVFPRARLRLSGQVRPLRFPDDEVVILGGAAIRLQLPRGSSLSLEADRRELLRGSTALDDQATVEGLRVVWKLERERGWLAAAAAEVHRYHDDNRGVSAYAYALAPLVRSESAMLWIGPAVAYRDTDESRIQLIGVRREPIPAGFRYIYDRIYDPYWTPQRLYEGRLVISSMLKVHPRATLTLHADGGRGQDRDLAFGPATGTTPLPVLHAPIDFERTYTPWAASAGLELALSQGIELRLRYEHKVTNFYESDQLVIALHGRF